MHGVVAPLTEYSDGTGCNGSSGLEEATNQWSYCLKRKASSFTRASIFLKQWAAQLTINTAVTSLSAAAK
jgi:hypothetical protein